MDRSPQVPKRIITHRRVSWRGWMAKLIGSVGLRARYLASKIEAREQERQPKDSLWRLGNQLRGIKEIVSIHIVTLEYSDAGLLPHDTIMWDGRYQILWVMRSVDS